MKFPLSWLKEILPIPHTPEQIAEILTVLGIEVEGMSQKGKDVLYEVSITPNLVHAASIIGIARELSSVTGSTIQWPAVAFKEQEKPGVTVFVEAEDLCPRYCGRMLFDVKVSSSPDWLIQRLDFSGIRSVNNVVDVTNLVMREQGHPLHAFDFDKVVGGKLIVRCARNGETITTLDGKEHVLHEDTLIIADEKGPLAIAGVMGGQRAEITESTKTVILEAAYFDPASVRRSAKRHVIHTDASYHFERGTDPNILERALERAVSVLQEMQVISSTSKIVDVSTKSFVPRQVSCRVSRLNKVLGTKLVLGEVESIFKRLFFSIVSISGETIVVNVGTYRNDVKEEIDLIEEVARLYGYDHIFKKDQKVVYQGSPIPHHPMYLFGKKARLHLLSEGLQELLTCNLISPDEAAWVAPAIFPTRSLIKILNPTSAVHSVMRPSMFSNLMQVVKENANHNIRNVAGFEIGKIHFSFKDAIKEQMALAIVWTGDRAPFHFQSKELPVDVFDLKGVIENLLDKLHIDGVNFQPSHLENFHPGRQAKIIVEGNREIGIMGEIHPSLLEKAGIKHSVFFAELSLEDLFVLSKKQIKMKPLPLFPGSSRDWTCTLPKKMAISDLLHLIETQKSSILDDVLVLDVYQSEALGSDQKNVTLRFHYRDHEKTVSFEEVEKEHERIIKSVHEKVNV